MCASLHSTPFTPPTPLTPFTPLTPLTPLTDRMHVHGCQRIYILRMKNRPETVKVAPLIRNSIACVPVHRLAAWLSPAGIHLPPADFRLLASCSRLLAVACWLPPLACPLSHDGCCLLASIFACWLFCFYLQLLLGTGGLDSAPDGDYLLAHAEGADPLGILAPLPQKAESTVQRLRHP